MTKADPKAKPARKTTTKRAAAKTTPAKRRTKATTSEPALTPVPDLEETPEEQPEAEGPSIDDDTREQFREAGLDDDQIDAILPVLSAIHTHGYNFGRYQARADVAEDLRFLAEARADYDRGTAPEPDQMDDAQKAACIRAEHVAAGWLAGIIEMSKAPAGWLPSWRWAEWQQRMADRGIEVQP